MYNAFSEKKLKKSGKINKRDFRFSLRDVPFGRKLSNLYFSEGLAKIESGAERKQILLNRTLRSYSISDQPARLSLVNIRPMYDNRTVPYTCYGTPAMLELNTEYGYIQSCFDNKDLIRIRGRGLGLRLFSELRESDFFVPRLDGTWQLSCSEDVELLIVPIKGKLDVDWEWEWEWKRSGYKGIPKASLDIEPDENGEFELAIHYAESNTERLQSYRLFESCVEEAEKDYNDWYAMYPAVPGRYEDTKKLSVYSIWICYIAPTGILKDDIFVFDKPNGGAFSWHQAYHSMAAVGDIDMSVQIMRTMFYYQDEYGEIPDIVDERYLNILATKPPFHGLAMLYILKHAGDKLTKAHCETLYEPLANWYKWWMTLRDTDNDGIPQYNQGCESGIDFTLMLAKGTPVECPDLIAYVILLAEALGKMAGIMGMKKEAKEWQARSEKMLDTLIKEFWDGEKFVARMSGSHDLVDFDEIEAYAPLMLGKRLPKEITDKMVETLADPEKYYTHFGLRSTPKSYKEGAAVPSFIAGFTQVKLIPGLYEAGHKELARDMLIGYCDANLWHLPGFGYLENDAPQDPDAPPNISAGDPRISGLSMGTCSSLAAAMFIVMAAYLTEISKEELAEHSALNRTRKEGK